MPSDSKYIANFKVNNQDYKIIDINKVAHDHQFELEQLPYCLRVLLENAVRNSDDEKIASYFKQWLLNGNSSQEIGYKPARVLMQDFTGVPAVVDLASMRDAMTKLGDDPQKINPSIPVDLVIDHSVQVDAFGNKEAFANNVKREFERNKERYQFLKWGQNSFRNFRVVPPGTGICHQVNLERLAEVIFARDGWAYPDSLVGTDSHTTMINGLSVLGWGVGGIEAEAAMLGQPLPMIIPEVIGVKLTGSLAPSATATDLVLTITQMLREQKVVGKFVEFFGPALEELPLSDRATISNMAPEYGATCGFFPIDIETIKYLGLSGRSSDLIQLVEEYAQHQKLWRSEKQPTYTKVIELDIGTVEPSLAGPKRPQDLVNISHIKENFTEFFPDHPLPNYQDDVEETKLRNGDLVLAAITSCTNTSNPTVMMAAGIVAKKAYELGLKIPDRVKTSLAPGSQVVTEYLNKSGLTKYLDDLGFYLVGYGCTTCIGNSGPLAPEIEQQIKEHKLVVSSVLSGNRNFEGRIHPHIKANYLASPPLVVAYALAGTINIDLTKDPIAHKSDGSAVYLHDIWPTSSELSEYVDNFVNTEMFDDRYKDLFSGDQNWRDIEVTSASTYAWPDSTYIKNPPYFDRINQPNKPLDDIKGARILALFGDSITTDHISPAGVIGANTPAARYLISQGVEPFQFNSYGARRGNHEVMMRGTFANIRIRNQLCPDIEGGITKNFLSGEQQPIYDAAMDYKKHKIPLVVIAGKEYGTGSSRDWAAKGTNLLGIKAVIAESFERIHRSNLVGMGVLPIALMQGMSYKDLNLDGNEQIDILGISDQLEPMQHVQIIFYSHGKKKTFSGNVQVYTDIEIDYIKNNGILENVIRNFNRK